MDELEISGKRYISTRRAAREHKYHSDYIGQLIRGGKVHGQKVGRSWYVDEVSLATYLGKEVPTPSTPPSVEEGQGQEVVAEKVVEVRAPMPSWRKIPEIAHEEVVEVTEEAKLAKRVARLKPSLVIKG